MLKEIILFCLLFLNGFFTALFIMLVYALKNPDKAKKIIENKMLQDITNNKKKIIVIKPYDLQKDKERKQIEEDKNNMLVI